RGCPSNLDGVFHRFGTSGEEGGLLGVVTRCESVDFLRQLHIATVGHDLKGCMRETVKLRANGLHHLWVLMAGVVHCDTGGEVDEAAPFRIPDLGVEGFFSEEVAGDADSGGDGSALPGFPSGLKHDEVLSESTKVQPL